METQTQDLCAFSREHFVSTFLIEILGAVSEVTFF